MPREKITRRQKNISLLIKEKSKLYSAKTGKKKRERRFKSANKKFIYSRG